MHLVRIGHVTINLEYLILSEDSRIEPPPKTLPEGVYRVTLETGRVIEFAGPLADLARKHVEGATNPRPVSPREVKPGKSIVREPKNEARADSDG